jgi:Alpha-L-fucosidase
MSSNSFPISRRRLLITTGVTGAAAAAGLLRGGTARASSGPQSYTASWPSVDQHPPAPEWFQDAKFGIYYHWGVFGVPAFSNEWYPRNMYNSGSPENQHHIATYGDPSVWPYHYFMLGANDKSGRFTKFQPKLTSAGGNWDPNAWAALFKAAGARFAGPVAEHHDGYSMWNSQVNEWNSVKTGPNLDLLSIHAQAIRAQGLKFMCSLRTAYHFNGYYQYVPPQSTPTPAEAVRPARHRRGEPAVVQQARRGHQRLPTRHDLAGLRPVPGRGVLPAAVPGGLLQRGGSAEQGRGGHLQGRVRQPGRGLRLRARRAGQHPDPLLADRRQRLPLHLVLRRRHQLLHDPGLCARADRPGQQGRQHAAEHRPDGRRHDPVRPAVDPAGHRGLPRPVRRVHLRHPDLVHLRRGPDRDGRRLVLRPAGRNPPRTSGSPAARTTRCCTAPRWAGRAAR